MRIIVRSTFLTFVSVCVALTLTSTVWAQGIPNLELLLTFDDQQDPAADSSGNNRNGELDDLELQWIVDDERGAVLEFGGANNGFIGVEIDELPADNFTIAMWAYRDPELCCDAGSGENDGLFHVQLDGDAPGGDGGTKIIGGWVSKAASEVWGRVIQDSSNRVNMDKSYIMEDEVWTHLAYRGDGADFELVVNGESGEGGFASYDGTLLEHNMIFVGKQGTETWGGRLDDFRVYSRALSDEEIAQVMTGDQATLLQAGDADMDLDFDQLDLVQVQIANKYLTGQAATWGEGDWNGAPGGAPGDPPAGNGVFDQADIIAALSGGNYLTGPYAAVQAGGASGDGQTSVIYNANTGELAVDAPAGAELTSINVDSAAGIFTAEAAQNLGGSFDNDADNNIFKATFGGSFGSLSFGAVAQAGLAEAFVLDDLTVVGSLAGGGDLGNVDLIYVPEPSTIVVIGLGVWLLAISRKSKPPRK